ncbi:MAG: hypothetical protein UY16_C0060G0010 [Candidatus Gottesmanbacteria bacterium GW2011_GWA2_47_9]|uniref:DUF5666 domain-containing protein n=1 Tax=Candidatus Gottesmanbacteria bacterium GW2011_GWA2_47_9 TaxID=1618445 RepID=A0A0G1WVL8_9BACT|nr:MAG: hypothetical protein UY16_C0060G0010 [Candidatus Gottesmanbacteria bacterium GW2011_GWA2_47_9]
MFRVQHLLFGLAFASLLASRVVAAPTPEATASGNQQQIEDLKDRLATKVAELRQSQRRAIVGTVKAVSVSTATIETKTKDIKIELTDDIVIVQVLKGKRTELTLDDLAKGDNVVVFGEYDTTLDLLKAKVIFIQSASVVQRFAGTVKEVDTEQFTITIATSDNKTIIVDIEKATKITLWDGQKLAKGGFTKLAVGNSVHVVGTPVPKKENRISALRILDIGNVTNAPTAAPEEPTPTVKTTPKSTPTPTP